MDLGYGFIGTRYGFQSKCSFQRLTPVDPPGESSRWAVPAVAPTMLHLTTTVRHLGSTVSLHTNMPVYRYTNKLVSVVFADDLHLGCILAHGGTKAP